MRVLILSDTHGHLHLINKLALANKADVVLHCGDFSFYVESRLHLSPDRELALRIRHSDLSKDVVKKAFSMSREEKIAVVKEHHLEGEFTLYAEGKEQFAVPTYVVWGNHEDKEVISQIQRGDIKVPNLHLVDENSDIVLGTGKGRFRIAGVGGNIIHYTFFDRKGSDVYYPSMRFVEWIKLLSRFSTYKKPEPEKVKEESEQQSQRGSGKGKGKAAQKQEQAKGEVDAEPKDVIPLWLMTHVSPGKCPALEVLGNYLGASLWFSGHMGPYLPQHYSLFTFADDYEYAERTIQDCGFLIYNFKKQVKLWEFWYFLNSLYPFSHQELQVDYILEREALEEKLLGSGTPTEEAPTENDGKVYTSAYHFPNEVRTFLGIIEPKEEDELDIELPSSAASPAVQPAASENTLPQSPETYLIPIPRAVKHQICESKSAKQLAETARFLLYIEPHLSKSCKEKLAKARLPSVNKEKDRNKVTEFPFIDAIPTLEELQLMKENVHWLSLPFSVPPGALTIENRVERTPSDYVKKSPLYFNLSDAYQGGYIIIDVDDDTGVLDIQMRGKFPPPHSVVDPKDNPWTKHQKATA